jgi:hypothetical protein
MEDVAVIRELLCFYLRRVLYFFFFSALHNYFLKRAAKGYKKLSVNELKFHDEMIKLFF